MIPVATEAAPESEADTERPGDAALPRVSVIIPVFNAERFLDATLESGESTSPSKPPLSN